MKTNRMFKLMSLTVTMVMLLALLVSCAPKPTEAPAEPAPAEAAPAEAAEPAKALRVALVGTQKFGDQNVMDSMKKGVEDAGAEFGVETKIIESLDAALYEEDVRALAEEGYDMIIGTWFEMGQPLHTVAKDFPDIKFVNIYQVAFEEPLPNILADMTAYHFATFLGGVMAAKMTETGKVGFIGGMNIPSIVADYNAFVQGAHLVNPDVETASLYAGSFEDPAKGKEAALAHYNNGLDVIAYDAAKTTLGGLEAAKETGNYFVADDPSQLDTAPANAFASHVINFNMMTYGAVKSMVEGTFEGGFKLSGIKEGVIDITNMDKFKAAGPAEMTAKVDDTWTFVEETKQQILDGTLEVIYDEKEDAEY